MNIKQDFRIPPLGTHITITEWGLGMTKGPIQQTIEQWAKTWIPRATVILMDETKIVTQEDYFCWEHHPRKGEGELDTKTTKALETPMAPASSVPPDVPVGVTFLDHGGTQTTLRYGSIGNAESSLRYSGIKKDRILKVSEDKECSGI